MGKKNDVLSWFTRPGAQKGPKSGGAEPFIILKERKGTGGVCAGYILELYGACVRTSSVHVRRGREGRREGCFLEFDGACVRTSSVHVRRGREGRWEGIFRIL